MLAPTAWHDTTDDRIDEHRLFAAVIAQAVQDAIKPLEKAGTSTTESEIRAARDFFLNPK